MTENLAARCRYLGLQAKAAVMGLWHAEWRTFWRSTEQRERELQNSPQPKFFPTVSITAVNALLMLQTEQPDWILDAEAEQIVSMLASLDRSLEDIQRNSSVEIGHDPTLNPFTLSLLVRATENAIKVRANNAALVAELRPKCDERLRALISSDTLRGDTFEVHPFLLYHGSYATRVAIPNCAAALSDDASKFLELLEEKALKACGDIFSRDRLGLLSPGDSVAAAFCAGILCRCDRIEASRYVQPALALAFSAQDQSGCWPLGRVIPENKDLNSSRIEISTHEIADCIVDVLLQRQRVSDGADRIGECSELERLNGALEFAEGSAVHLSGTEPPFRGWCSDHPYGKPIIESWTSANVLQFALGLSELLREVEASAALRTFVVSHPTDQNWPRWLRWHQIRESAEPDSQTHILMYIEDHIINPILRDRRRLPPRDSVSGVLFGPPGTSKTTIVKGIADALKWPIVLLSPGSFIEKGLEFIEAQSNDIFTRLLELRRAIVIFDECDELFRRRTPSDGIEQMRGITAFVTASMLPKLQELHDKGEVLFFVCTNHFASLDNAVRRPGRVDHVIAVGPPDHEARYRFALEAVGLSDPSRIEEAALETLADKTEMFTRSEVRRAAQTLFANAAFSSLKAAREKARLIASSFEESRTITQEEYSAFQEDKRFSRPHIEGGER